MAREILTMKNKHGEMVEIPSVFAVCSSCEGRGTEVNSAFGDAMTATEWAEMDLEQRDKYMEGGYDIACSCCKGKRVELIPDYERLNFGHRRLLVLSRQMDRARAEVRAEWMAEQRYFGNC